MGQHVLGQPHALTRAHRHTHQRHAGVSAPLERERLVREEGEQAALSGELQHEAHERVEAAREELYDVGVVQARHHPDLVHHVADGVCARRAGRCR